MPGSRMRLDLKGFQRRRVAGAVAVTVVIVAALFAAYFFHREAGVAEYYLRSSGREIPNAAVFDKIITQSEKPVAVMFESYTCPACARMRPFWSKLEAREGLPVEFYHIYATGATISVFQRYGVEETPTFIVFVDGKPVARHVGTFEAPHGKTVDEVMLEWAVAAAEAAKAPRSPREYAERGLEVWRAQCASCHGAIGGLGKADLEEWLRTAARTATRAESAMAVPALTGRIKEALEKGVLLSQLYEENFSGLVDAVLGMRKYIPDLMYSEALYTAYLLDYATAVLEDKQLPVYPWMRLANESTAVLSNVSSSRGGNATRLEVAAAAAAGASAASTTALVGAVSALVAGVVSVFSPCVLPLLVAQVSVVASSGRRLGLGSCAAGGAAAAGVIAVGALFLVASGLAASIQSILLPVVAAAIVAAGLASVLGVPVELQGLVSSRRGGLLGFCGVYGFLAVQCNLPIVLGVLLLIAGLGLTGGGVAALLALAVGSGVPLAVVMYLASRGGAGLAEKMLRHNRLLNVVGGSVLLAAGVYLLLYSLHVV